jgi:hypothetical protein
MPLEMFPLVAFINVFGDCQAKGSLFPILRGGSCNYNCCESNNPGNRPTCFPHVCLVSRKARVGVGFQRARLAVGSKHHHGPNGPSRADELTSRFVTRGCSNTGDCRAVLAQAPKVTSHRPPPR